MKNHDDIIISNFGLIIEKLNSLIKIMENEIDRLLPKDVLELTNLCGIEKLTASKGKLISKASFVNYYALASIEYLSGKTTKHCINR